MILLDSFARYAEWLASLEAPAWLSTILFIVAVTCLTLSVANRRRREVA